MKKIYTLLALFLVVAVQAQHKANYALAARFAPKKVNKMVFTTSVDPHWLKNGNKFWYTYETAEGKFWYIVDADKGTKKQIWDNDKLAASLTRIVKDPMDAKHITLDSMQFVHNETAIQFEVKSTQEVDVKDTTAKKTDKAVSKEKKVFYFEYDLKTESIKELVGFKKPKRKPVWASLSPNEQLAVFGKKHNLYMMDKANYEKALINENDSSIIETQLTFDGAENFSYYNVSNLTGDGETNSEKEKEKNKRKPVYILWSPNSEYFTSLKVDNTKLNDLWVINSVADPRPTLETYKYWMAGEKEGAIDHLMLFNIATKKMKEIKADKYKHQDINTWQQKMNAADRDNFLRPNIWLGTNQKFYFSRTSRDLKNIDLCSVDVTADTAVNIITESLNTSIENKRPEILSNGDIIQWSEQDGWAHYYLYDSKGNLKQQITNGSYHCEDIVGVNEAAKTIYFTASGKEYLTNNKAWDKQITKAKNAESEDPYYLHLYKINFDGSGLQLLNAGNFDNSISINDNCTYFVNNASRVNTTPVTTLHKTSGALVTELEQADLSNLWASGYKFPEPFKVKADDGITDLYGVMYKPYNFDSSKVYPIIEYVYPGPQTEAVNKYFTKPADRVDRLAQLGFIVITIGNRGGHPSRSKWYHNYGYGNLRDYGLADKKAAVEQLADKYKFINREKVGIHGHSGGGFMSTAAMLVYPNFFKVAVSSAGNHDNSIYNRWWSEKHHGVKQITSEKDTSFQYSIDKNPDLAKNLKGKLLLVHGEIDNNVHPANTMRVVNALIKANKRFDMLLLPTQRHGFGDMQEYWFWKAADYFTQHLMGDKTERTTDVDEINNEQEKKK